MKRELFRSEVARSRSVAFTGDVAIAVPLSWQVVGYFLFGAVAVTFTFLCSVTYAKVETVTGLITPQSGVSSILTTRPGVITSVSVHEGDIVAAGTPLASVRVEEDSPSALSSAAQIEGSISRQRAELSVQLDASISAGEAQLAQLRYQRQGLVAEIAELGSQIGLQKDLVASAQRDLERTRVLSQRGFISGRDIDARHESLLSRQQGLSQLTQSLASKRAAMAELERSVAQAAAQSRAQSASLAAAREEVTQQAASAQGARAYVLRAPVRGVVAALSARTGQSVSAQAFLMSIVPAHSPLVAELAVPSSAIGFVKTGQNVRLAIDAFPYQQFGAIDGKVRTVAAGAVGAPGPNGSKVLVYPVTITLNRAKVTAFGRDQPLISGMTLNARIITQRQSLLEWLFEPLFAVRRR